MLLWGVPLERIGRLEQTASIGTDRIAMESCLPLILNCLPWWIRGYQPAILKGALVETGLASHSGKRIWIW